MTVGLLGAGLHRRTVPEDGRRYSLWLPPAYDEARIWPLVVVLHYGYGGPPLPFYGEGILAGLAVPALEELEAVIVAPDCYGDSWASERSERDVLGLVDHLGTMFRLDAQRTLLTGYSMGGIGTWFLAARQPDRFQAAIPMAAQPPLDVASLEWRMPLHVIHSRQDELFSLQPVEEAVDGLKAAGAAVELAVLEGITHFETHRFVPALREAVPWIRRAWG